MKKLALATLALVTAFGATQAMANDKVVKMKKNGWVDVLTGQDSKVSYQPSTQKNVKGQQQFWAKITVTQDTNPNDGLSVNDYTALLGNLDCQAKTYTLLEASRFNAQGKLIETRQAPAQAFVIQPNDRLMQELYHNVCTVAPKK